MLWAASDTGADEDPRELQRRREAYARELDHQIALRRARQQQEQREREEFERKLAPSEHSPSKWLVEGGHYDTDADSPAPWKVTQSMELPKEQHQDRGAPTDEANGVSSSHPRFRVTDESEASQRLRERAQQMQWKRILDEQVQEKARLKEKQEEERRRSEAEAAREEMRYLREQQLRAQRRLGPFSPALAQSTEKRTEINSPYQSIPSPELPSGQRSAFQPSTSLRRSFQGNSDTRGFDEMSPYYHREKEYGSTAVADTLMPPPVPSRAPMPPPAPTRMQMPQGSNGRMNYEDERDRIGSSAGNGELGRQMNSQDNEVYLSRLKEQQQQQQLQQEQQQSHILEEYRSLLAEIRREREELRRERDEVRREKEELRVQRALLQLENEKMASIVESQRALNEQHQADLQTQQAQQQAISYQQKLLPVQTVAFESDHIGDGGGLQNRLDDAPSMQAFSRLNQIQQSLGSLAINEDHLHTAPQGRRRPSPSPMSMADFASVAPSPVPTNAEPSPRFQRLSRYRPIPAVQANDENQLNESLAGESVFVPLSPKPQPLGPSPRITSSPTTAGRRGDITSRRSNPLRNSRVIKSRGFYDVEHELKSGDKADPWMSDLASDSFRDSLGSDLDSSLYDDDEDGSEAGSDLEEPDGDERPPAASGLFQVQVLV
ncbi:hypothetical protein PHYBOEH_000150 [Phytophthora boehmeriae]|uniref:Uncharacterized protein n=1 Tax=Phytophthora boehmeriae TaxID=109152 RepID=A0A8T1XBF7_9STRA|nr:hypothetical protein PHYBOEH_000150 [Phytophthora boehmeriae]